MHIQCRAQQDFDSSPQAVFELMLDPDRFPACFRGYGPIPAIRSIVLASPLAVGSIRHIHNADGSILTELVTVLDKPARHAYVLSGFRAPFSWLVTQGEATWTLDFDGARTRVLWDYAFTATTVLATPLAFILLQLFMAGAMRRCLENMAPLLKSNAPGTAIDA